MLVILLVIAFPFQETQWLWGHLERAATRRQSQTVLPPAVTTVILNPVRFMSINVLEQAGLRRHTSKQQTMMLVIILVLAFPFQETQWLLGHLERAATRRQSQTALTPAVTTALLTGQFMSINVLERTGHRKHISKRPTAIQVIVLVREFPSITIP